ncbi:MAG: aspartyl protease family protein [Chloroflexi bacterium]|nr:aspartyl protease family protein [Chloroflexota bacterium]
MGTFQYPLTIFSPEGARSETLEATVDTDATYTQLPQGVARALGLQPQEQRVFRLASGERVERDVAYVQLQVNGRRISTPCILAPDEAPALLGAVTLEELGVAPDPVNKRLVPAEGLLLTLLAQNDEMR